MAAPLEAPAAHPNLPPGFRFHPTDEELVVHYLKRKANSVPLPVTIIAEIDLYKFDPWELPSKASFGEHEWYFFSPRDRKYPNGARPNRAATSGYWKATGTDKPVLTSNGTHKVGVKKALVFYGGKPPKGIKTNWIMHEYRLFDANISNNISSVASNKKPSLRLDDWVLCRIFYKKNNAQAVTISENDHKYDHSVDANAMLINVSSPKPQPPRPSGFAALLGCEDGLFDGVLSPSPPPPPPPPPPAGAKRAVAVTTSFWNDEAARPPGGGKRFRGDIFECGGSSGTVGGGATGIPNTASFHDTAMILGSTTPQFQLPTDMSWNS